MGWLKRAADIFAAPAVGAYKGAVSSGVAPSVRTVKGALRGDTGDIARVGIAAVALVPIAGAAAKLRAVSRGAEAAQEARTGATLAFRDVNPMRSMAGRVRNVLNDKIATDRAEAVFTAARNAELPGKITALRAEITRIDNMPKRSAQARGIDRGISLVKKAVTGGEQGWIRASTQSESSLPFGVRKPPTSILKFGKGTFPGAANIGEGTKAGYYEAHLTGSKTPGAVKVSWLNKHGNVDLKDLKNEVTAIGRGLKARSISAIEYEPLESGRRGSASRSRLFARVLKGTGFKNIDRGAPDIKRTASRGWGARLGSERGSVTLPGTRAFGSADVKALKASVYNSIHEGASDVVMPSAQSKAQAKEQLRIRSKFHGELISAQKMVPMGKIHSARLSKQ